MRWSEAEAEAGTGTESKEVNRRRVGRHQPGGIIFGKTMERENRMKIFGVTAIGL